MNAVFIHIPKTAGLYIQAVLRLDVLRYPTRAKRLFKQTGRVTFGHLDYKKLLKRGTVSKEFDQSAFKFAFVRNPFDRAVSHFFYARKKHPDILDPAVDFLTFTRTLADYGRTFQPQYVPIDGLCMDFIGRYESLEKDLSHVARLIGVEPAWDVEKQNATNHFPYWTYYDEESEDNVRRFYSEDFRRFGYDDHLLHGQFSYRASLLSVQELAS